MNLKRIALLSIISAVAAIGSISAQTIDKVRIYINPGHGGWESDNRPMSTIPFGSYKDAVIDTCGYFESNTNLWTGLALFHKLKDYGVPHNGKNALDLKQNIVMSRIANGPWPVNENDYTYDRNLSEIAAEVEANNFDMFISIHSNATTGNHDVATPYNHLLYLYRGTTGNNYVANSEAMCRASWPHVNETPTCFGTTVLLPEAITIQLILGLSET